MSQDTVQIDKETFDRLNKLTKRELIEKFCIAAVDARGARDESESLQTKLDKAEAYVEQGRAMVNAVMERWYEYDV